MSLPPPQFSSYGPETWSIRSHTCPHACHGVSMGVCMHGMVMQGVKQFTTGEFSNLWPRKPLFTAKMRKFCGHMEIFDVCRLAFC